MTVSTKRGGEDREQIVDWLRAEGVRLEQEIQQLVTVLAKVRRGQP